MGDPGREVVASSAVAVSKTTPIDAEGDPCVELVPSVLASHRRRASLERRLCAARAVDCVGLRQPLHPAKD